MTMVERVARAIYKSLTLEEGAFLGDFPEDRTEHTVIDGAFDLATLARAAIEAMREPTQAMLTAPTSIMGGGFQNSHSDLETWDAMIDAALNEK